MEIYLHMVWATYFRAPFLAPDIKKDVWNCVCHEVDRLGGLILAIGGMPDHVHVIVRIPGRLSASKLAQQLKGVSSHFVNDRFKSDERFQWQSGYSAFSLGRSDIPVAIRYVQNQKRRHETGKVWPQWEEVDMEAGDDTCNG